MFHATVILEDTTIVVVEIPNNNEPESHKPTFSVTVHDTFKGESMSRPIDARQLATLLLMAVSPDGEGEDVATKEDIRALFSGWGNCSPIA